MEPHQRPHLFCKEEKSKHRGQSSSRSVSFFSSCFTYEMICFFLSDDPRLGEFVLLSNEEIVTLAGELYDEPRAEFGGISIRYSSFNCNWTRSTYTPFNRRDGAENMRFALYFGYTKRQLYEERLRFFTAFLLTSYSYLIAAFLGFFRKEETQWSLEEKTGPSSLDRMTSIWQVFCKICFLFHLFLIFPVCVYVIERDWIDAGAKSILLYQDPLM